MYMCIGVYLPERRGQTGSLGRAGQWITPAPGVTSLCQVIDTFITYGRIQCVGE